MSNETKRAEYDRSLPSAQFTGPRVSYGARSRINPNDFIQYQRRPGVSYGYNEQEHSMGHYSYLYRREVERQRQRGAGNVKEGEKGRKEKRKALLKVVGLICVMLIFPDLF